MKPITIGEVKPGTVCTVVSDGRRVVVTATAMKTQCEVVYLSSGKFGAYGKDEEVEF